MHLKKQHFNLLLIIVITGLSTFLQAQDTGSFPTDTSSAVDVRVPTIQDIRAFESDPDFQYQQVAQNPDSFGSRFLGFIITMIFRFVNHPVGGMVTRIVLILIVGSAVFVFLNQLMGGELVNVVRRKNRSSSLAIGLNENELSNTDFETKIREAIQAQNYHAATRYVYLAALQKLKERELIIWKPEKTNLDYQRELTGHQLYADFSHLTDYYDFVEYGDFIIDEYTFERVKRFYNAFNIKLAA
jgi:hypothetical protein